MKFFNTLMGRYTLVVVGMIIQTPLLFWLRHAAPPSMLFAPEWALAAIAFLVANLAMLWAMLNFLPARPASLASRMADVGPTCVGVAGCLVYLSATNSLSYLWVGVVVICVAAIFAMAEGLSKLMASE